MIKVTFSLKNRSIIRGMSGLICACKDCGLLSYRTGERKGCPFCGEKNIRPATYTVFQSMRALLQPESSLRKGKPDQGKKALGCSAMGA